VCARADGSRLSVAVVESGSTGAAALADEVAAVTGGDAYEVGARAVALVVPGVGRADALGVLARIQAACGATGSAAEQSRARRGRSWRLLAAPRDPAGTGARPMPDTADAG
jgi:hypothetical protein